MSEIKKNFIYSSILTSANFVFPLIVYPYVSRVLGVSNIGICNFVDSLINYCMMFSLMGISIVGIREVASCKNDPVRLSKTFSSLFFLNTIATVIILAILALSVFAVPKLYEYKEMMLVGFFKVIFNYLLIDWFYKGIEDFKYITKYGFTTKVLYVISVFVFVTEKNDYCVYYLLSMLMIASNAIINLWHSRNLVRFRFSAVALKPYLSSFLILGVYILLTSMYTTFNVTYLGFVCNEAEVGYYTTATKLHVIFLALFTAFTNVMMPRMSSLFSEGNFGEFKDLLSKSLHVLFVFAMPVVVFSTVLAPQIIQIISGSGYEPAVTPMRIIMPLVLIIGYEQIIIIQVLMPLKKDKVIFINSCVGAVVGVLANMLLVSSLKSVGSAFVWISSELVVLMMAQSWVSKYLKIKFPFRDLVFYAVLALPCALAAFMIQPFIENAIACVFVCGAFIFIYYYILYIYILRDSFVISSIKSIKSKILHTS